jgi:hypothetical protein
MNAIISPNRNYLRTLILLFGFITLIPFAYCFDIDISPKSICCGDNVSVTISMTNNGSVEFEGYIDIYIIDTTGDEILMDSLTIILQPHESEVFTDPICPMNCNSDGTYQVIVDLLNTSGQVQDTRTDSFIVSNSGDCQTSECTWTFDCNNNVVRRLCKHQNGREYWKDYDNCNSYNPPRQCINGVCVDIAPSCDQQTCPPPRQCINGECVDTLYCNQQACQSRNKPIGQSYTKNGATYQRYMKCNCIADSCQCRQVEKQK